MYQFSRTWKESLAKPLSFRFLEASANLPREASANLPREASANLPREALANLPREASANLPREKLNLNERS